MTWEELKIIVNNRLNGETPDQVLAYIDAQATDLASTKEILKELAAIVAFLANNTSFRLGD